MRLSLLLAFVFTILFSVKSYAALIPPVSSLTIDGQVILNPVGATKSLICGLNGSSDHCSFRTLSDAGTTPYQVPAGKSFRMLAVRCSNTSSGIDGYSLGYADNDVGYGTTNAYTNLVAPVIIFNLEGGSIQPNFSLALGSGILVPSGKYPSFDSQGVGSLVCIVYGIES